MIGGGRLKKSSATKTTFHRLEATKELEDMEPLFLLLFRRFHVRQLADGGMS